LLACRGIAFPTPAMRKTLTIISVNQTSLGGAKRVYGQGFGNWPTTVHD